MSRVESRGISGHMRDPLLKPERIKLPDTGVQIFGRSETERFGKKIPKDQKAKNFLLPVPGWLQIRMGEKTKVSTEPTKRETEYTGFVFPPGVYPLRRGIKHQRGFTFIGGRGTVYEVVYINGHWGQQVIGHVNKND